MGFIAVLDQSGSSTPKALEGYGIGAILFENTMERTIEGQPTANYLAFLVPVENLSQTDLINDY